MLVMRLSRVGRRNHTQYRIVVQEKSKAPTGKHLAIVGSYDPHLKNVVLKEERIKEFLAQGTQPSDSVHNLLVSHGIIKGEKRIVKVPAKKVEEVVEEKKEKEDVTESADESKSDANDATETQKKEQEEK
jgi:small subunit ribosomal protein S16